MGILLASHLLCISWLQLASGINLLLLLRLIFWKWQIHTNCHRMWNVKQYRCCSWVLKLCLIFTVNIWINYLFLFTSADDSHPPPHLRIGFFLRLKSKHRFSEWFLRFPSLHFEELTRVARVFGFFLSCFSISPIVL